MRQALLCFRLPHSSPFHGTHTPKLGHLIRPFDLPPSSPSCPMKLLIFHEKVYLYVLSMACGHNQRKLSMCPLAHSHVLASGAHCHSSPGSLRAKVSFGIPREAHPYPLFSQQPHRKALSMLSLGQEAVTVLFHTMFQHLTNAQRPMGLTTCNYQTMVTSGSKTLLCLSTFHATHPTMK
jgi:hypothetical protein